MTKGQSRVSVRGLIFEPVTGALDALLRVGGGRDKRRQGDLGEHSVFWDPRIDDQSREQGREQEVN